MRQVVLMLRTLEVVAIVCATTCVGLGKGWCYKTELRIIKEIRISKGCGSDSRSDCSIGTWNEFNKVARSKHLYGQYWVFVSSLLLALSALFTLLKALQGNHVPSANRCIGACICLLNGALQVWYTVEGWDLCWGFLEHAFFNIGDIGDIANIDNVFKMTVYSQSWAAAAAMYFLLARRGRHDRGRHDRAWG